MLLSTFNRKVAVSFSFIWSFITLFLSSAINYNTDKSWYYIVNPFENMLWFFKYIIPNLGNIGTGLVFLVILPSFFIIFALMLTSSNLKFFLFGIVLERCINFFLNVWYNSLVKPFSPGFCLWEFFDY